MERAASWWRAKAEPLHAGHLVNFGAALWRMEATISLRESRGGIRLTGWVAGKVRPRCYEARPGDHFTSGEAGEMQNLADGRASCERHLGLENESAPFRTQGSLTTGATAGATTTYPR